jgi:phosphoglycerate dehydrogenase-like enzyme
VELTGALVLGLARHLAAESRALRDGGPWQATVGQDLDGRTIGLLGLGKIGSRVARVATAFGMDVLAWSENLTAERAADAGARLADSKQDLLRRSDVVSVHLVLSDRTRGLLGEPKLRAVRSHADLVNTSRAAVVDRTALLRARARAGSPGPAWTSSTPSPFPADDPLRCLPNVLATPQLGFVTERNYRTFSTEAVEDITALLVDAPVRVLVGGRPSR